MLLTLTLLYRFEDAGVQWTSVTGVTSRLLGLQNKDFYLPAKDNVSRDQQYDDEDELTQILKDTIAEFSFDREDLKRLPCPNASVADEACFEPECAATFPTSPRERLRHILASRRQIPDRYLQAMKSATASVTSSRYMFVTAGSPNHYHELQGLVRTLHQYVFPHLSNYTFVIFDLGFTAFQRYVIEKNCRCTVLDFPFSELPDFVRYLTCYAWKPIAVSSLADKAEYLLWMDACIRFEASISARTLDELFRRAEERGAQGILDAGSVAVRTAPSAFRFYGDQSSCFYAPFAEMLSGFVLLYVNRFTRNVIIQPWLSCAFDRRCMCVKDFDQLYKCGNTPPRQYGRCHRFDQSSLNIIYSKLFVDYRPIVFLPRGYVQLSKTKENWFEPRESDVITLSVVIAVVSALLMLAVMSCCISDVSGGKSVRRFLFVTGVKVVVLVTLILGWLLWVFL